MRTVRPSTKRASTSGTPPAVADGTSTIGHRSPPLLPHHAVTDPIASCLAAAETDSAADEEEPHPCPITASPSIDATTRLAQKQFNRWLDLDDDERTPSRLIEMLGFDYFTLLDRLTIARSRKHLEKYYGTLETGRFPHGCGRSTSSRTWT